MPNQFDAEFAADVSNAPVELFLMMPKWPLCGLASCVSPRSEGPQV